MAVNTTKFPARGANSNSASARKASSRAVGRHPSDDEILGLVTAVAPHAGSENYEDEGASGTSQEQNPAAAPDQSSATAGEGNSPVADPSSVKPAPVPAELAPILSAHPQLREAWDAAHEYRQVFATPAAARDAQQQLADLDGMFFSSQPADHAALAARIHKLSPEAFHGLAQAMQAHAAKIAALLRHSKLPRRRARHPWRRNQLQPRLQPVHPIPWRQ